MLITLYFPFIIFSTLNRKLYSHFLLTNALIVLYLWTTEPSGSAFELGVTDDARGS